MFKEGGKKENEFGDGVKYKKLAFAKKKVIEGKFPSEIMKNRRKKNRNTSIIFLVVVKEKKNYAHRTFSALFVSSPRRPP